MPPQWKPLGSEMEENSDEETQSRRDKAGELEERSPKEGTPPPGSSNLQQLSNEYVLNIAFYSILCFVVFGLVFALASHSQSVWADSEAMSVDAMTYLFNRTAERLKNRPLSKWELTLPETQRNIRRELERLYLELVPPTISAVILIAVTIFTLRKALWTLALLDYDAEHATVSGVSLPIMLMFATANLTLDIFIATFFVRAIRSHNNLATSENGSTVKDDGSLKSLILKSICGLGCTTTTANKDSHYAGSADESTRLLAGPQETESFVEHKNGLSLNMCSAWVHIIADALRSAAVLIAAGYATVVSTVRPERADSVAAIVVSFIILVSLLPLMHRLGITSMKLVALIRHRNTPSTVLSDDCER